MFYNDDTAIYTEDTSMYRILIVDNEAKLRQAILKYARFHGYETLKPPTGWKRLHFAAASALISFCWM
jgi:DNA-binding response OmpR family regulator